MTNRNVPKLSTIEKIARALEVDPLVFFQKEKPPLPEEKEAELQIKKKRIITLLDAEIDKILRQ